MNGSEDTAMKTICPCCNQPTLPRGRDALYAICPDCGWENDPVQEKNPYFEGGANRISLIQARNILYRSRMEESGSKES